ncbi:hypothetical protein DL766_007291 [Monosporascus sp. MC13-8B]|uniref:Uncharacterized protein n=1 Tax=Monosporascus cannonballus TaxID=155416 RepID=A0ABY0H644_9PEZI|nr:hypothetical protein DL763_011302 [Monosporascus cannonballus]RYO85868.1 hypothetical protein DL762_005015 [Monosporascus cannonballus]RYP24385.1 hypothetical protein DL766_007291 [Monosporascus sp. MC13-8B]
MRVGQVAGPFSADANSYNMRNGVAEKRAERANGSVKDTGYGGLDYARRVPQVLAVKTPLLRASRIPAASYGETPPPFPLSQFWPAASYAGAQSSQIGFAHNPAVQVPPATFIHQHSSASVRLWGDAPPTPTLWMCPWACCLGQAGYEGDDRVPSIP